MNIASELDYWSVSIGVHRDLCSTGMAGSFYKPSGRPNLPLLLLFFLIKLSWLGSVNLKKLKNNQGPRIGQMPSYCAAILESNTSSLPSSGLGVSGRVISPPTTWGHLDRLPKEILDDVLVLAMPEEALPADTNPQIR